MDYDFRPIFWFFGIVVVVVVVCCVAGWLTAWLT